MRDVHFKGLIDTEHNLLLMENVTNLIDYLADLRDPSTIPLNFTKSINLTISERGINALHQSGHTEAIEPILNNAIPMHGRMIHGRDSFGDLWEASQAYDVHGRVSENTWIEGI